MLLKNRTDLREEKIIFPRERNFSADIVGGAV
jgi:hypothetical protein